MLLNIKKEVCLLFSHSHHPSPALSLTTKAKRLAVSLLPLHPCSLHPVSSPLSCCASSLYCPVRYRINPAHFLWPCFLFSKTKLSILFHITTRLENGVIGVEYSLSVRWAHKPEKSGGEGRWPGHLGVNNLAQLFSSSQCTAWEALP